MDIRGAASEIETIAALGDWTQDEHYSVFAQPDRDYYESQRSHFEHKYRTLRAIAMVMKPRTIIELGTHAGSGADAYLTGVGYDAHYTGYDSFGIAHLPDGGVYDPLLRCRRMFRDRGYEDFNLVTCDLRDMREIPAADLVCVDAGHDYRNAYQDLLLAMRSGSRWIHVDDYHGEDVRNAVRDMTMNYPDKFSGLAEVKQWSGSVILEVKQ